MVGQSWFLTSPSWSLVAFSRFSGRTCLIARALAHIKSRPFPSCWRLISANCFYNCFLLLFFHYYHYSYYSYPPLLSLPLPFHDSSIPSSPTIQSFNHLSSSSSSSFSSTTTTTLQTVCSRHSTTPTTHRRTPRTHPPRARSTSSSMDPLHQPTTRPWGTWTRPRPLAFPSSSPAVPLPTPSPVPHACTPPGPRLLPSTTPRSPPARPVLRAAHAAASTGALPGTPPPRSSCRCPASRCSRTTRAPIPPCLNPSESFQSCVFSSPSLVPYNSFRLKEIIYIFSFFPPKTNAGHFFPRPAKPFGCDACGKSFTRFADLKRHSTSVHYPVFRNCPVEHCSRKGSNGFPRQDHLVEHLRSYHHLDVPKRRAVKRSAKAADL